MNVEGARPRDGVSRRGFVQALVVGGAVAGAATAGRASADAPAPDRLVLRCGDVRSTRLGTEPGTLPGVDDVASTYGTYALEPSGSGRFDSASVPGSGGRFVMHRFDLGDGTLLGMGSGPLDDGVFAVIGGTGSCAGAVGSYTARQSPRGLGGDGTAEFVFDLTGRRG